MSIGYGARDAGGFFDRGQMDNIKPVGFQEQPRFFTTYDQLLLGLNNQGRISNFTTSGQAALFAVHLNLGKGENNFTKGNFLKLSFCEGGSNAGEPCEGPAQCPGGRDAPP